METLQNLIDRSLVYQMTNEEKLNELLSTDSLSFYIGFDATASSLHLGHLVPLMIASHLQRAGHRPHILIGGATALVGDPSGRSTERSLESRDTIDQWAVSLKNQMRRFLDFSDENVNGALLLNNADWLNKLNYITFLRDIGKHFSVNRMLTAESVKQRLETGLSFLEFNYMLLQSYDFLHLFRDKNCILQVGGADQWGNIVAGIDLIRRKEAAEVYGFTCPLVTTSTGEKMSKSQPGGAIWLDPNLTSPYQYYQFWINVDDRDAAYFMKLYTYLSVNEIAEYEKLSGADTRRTKEKLAFEATAIAHGLEEAKKAQDAAKALFAGNGHQQNVPSTDIPSARITEGISAIDLFTETGLCPSRGEVKRLGKQGGLYIQGERVSSPEEKITVEMLEDNSLLLRAGKKRYHRIIFTG
ncbi:MAG: tyrosine--tRNA ligase [Candidatus Sabulitectum sp.]|nr:tyrosine--tRNA ligase [Candidatus Sabulitectum sp.]